jgi:hypothetical protein
MVVMEMVQELAGEEAFVIHPHKVVLWLDPFDPDLIG